MINQAKISSMRQGGKKLAAIKNTVTRQVVPGATLAELDSLAATLMYQSGGEPAFSKVPGYKWATCINLNAGIVHGIPHAHIVIKDGDLVSLDMGLFYQGYYTDTSISLIAGKKTADQQHFLQMGKAALATAVKVAKAGNHIGHISRAIQTSIEAAGYNCLRNYTGHGIGKNLHEFPSIPCVLTEAIEFTPKIEAGMTLAIEVMYMEGSYQTVKLADGWTIAVKDGSPAGLFEETVLITKQGPQILTA